MGEKLNAAYYRREAQLMRIKSDIENDPELAAEFTRLAQAFEHLAEDIERKDRVGDDV
ncbi:MAG TPA: hypothetical protein VGB82_10635 [Alphaproteobacteria bacterium]